MTQQELKQLIKACRQNDRFAQKQLYLHFYNYGMTICSRYAANREEAKELLNDGFVKVFTRLTQYNNKLSFKAWLNKILVHTAIDRYRKQQRQPKLVDIAYAQMVEVEASVLQQLSAKDLLELVQQLPPSYRVVFNLYVVEGYNHREIAEKLGIKEGTSKSNLAKARRRLQRIINQSSTSKKYYG